MSTYYIGNNGNLTLAPTSNKQTDKKKKKKKGKVYTVGDKGNLIEVVEDDIAPVTTTKKKDDGGLDFFQKGAFEDGYQFGDVTKATLGTLGDAGLGILQGGVSLLEGVKDAAQYGVAGISDWIGEDEFAESVRNDAIRNSTEELFSGANDYLDQYSVLGKTSDAVMQGLGQVGAIVLTGGIGGAAGLGAAGVTALTTGLMGVSGIGSGMSEAYGSGATDEEAAVYGISSGVINAGSELLFGGLGKTVKALGLSRGLSSLDDIFAQKLSSKLSSQVAKNFAEFGVKASAEGFEEVIAGLGTSVAKKLTYMDDKELSEIIKDENLFEQFVVGMATSGMIQSGYIPKTEAGSLKEANKQGRDFITGYTKNEQLVIDKEVENRINEAEKDNKTLTKKEKQKILEQVQSDMAKGRISTDTIESVLGGDTYKKYSDSVKNVETLENEFKTLGKTKNPTLEQSSRYGKLEGLIEDAKKNSSTLKEQLSKEVSELAKNERLTESYNDIERRKQNLDIDTSEYTSESAKQTAKNFIESGLMHNGVDSHDFADLCLRVAENRGYTFEVTTTERLQKSIENGNPYKIDVDPSKVEGFVSGKGKTIVINLDAKKSLTSLVGHEVTHTLADTDALHKAVFKYAQTKGEYDSRLEDIKKRYKGKDADVNEELAADLLGDYLFTDSEFIKTLSVEKPSLFKRVWNEIKYLCKMATAGSKELRELERVKHEFEKVWQERSEEIDTEGGVKLSLSNKNIKKDAQIPYVINNSYQNVAVNDKKALNKLQNDVRNIKRGTYENKATGYRADINSTTIGKIINPTTSFNPWDAKHNYIENLNASLYLTELFENAVYVDSKLPQKTKNVGKQIKEYHHFVAPIEMNNRDYRVMITAREKANSNTLYIVDAEILPNKKRGASVGSQKLTTMIGAPRTISIADLVNGVNIYDYNSKQNNTYTDAGLKFSLSEDSDGRSLTDEQKEYFKDSKVVDKNGNLMVVYHGSEDYGFTVFDTNKTGDKSSLFFTNDYDMAQSYVNDDSKTYKVYLNIKNPLVVDAKGHKWHNIRIEDSNDEVMNKIEKYVDIARGYDEAIDISLVSESLGNLQGSVEYIESEMREVFEEEGIEGALSDAEIEEMRTLAKELDDIYENWDEDAHLDEDGEPMSMEYYISQTKQSTYTTRQISKIAKEQGYDGVIIENVDDNGKFHTARGVQGFGNVYIAFDSNQIKSVDNQKPTSDADINLSLSSDVAPKEYGDFNIYGKDIKLQDDIAPTEHIVEADKMVDAPAEVRETLKVAEDYAPLTEEESIVRDDKQIKEHYFLDNIAPETEEQYNGEYADHIKPSDPFYEKDIWEVGKDRKQKAYMYENPEVKPFFQQEARYMLGELDNSSKGEKFYNDQLYYDTNGEMGFFGTKRHTSEEIAYLLDTFNYTYKDIAKGLNAIIEDNGKENNAISKRIEFLIDERLRLGYTDFWFGDKIPPNQDYINLLNEKQITEYDDESWNNWLRGLAETGQYYSVPDEIAPTPQEYIAIESERPKRNKTEPRMVRVKEGTTEDISPVANVLTEEPTVDKKKSRFWSQAMELVADKGFVFENLAKKTKNRELEAKWNFIRYADSKAQDFIGNGTDGVKSLDALRKEVEQKGLTKDLYEYVYHLHNIDRMSLESRYDDVENKAVFGDSVSAEVSQAAVEVLEERHPELKKYANEIYSINNYLRGLLVEGGVISQETADLWAEMYPHYVPIRRAGEHGLSINVPLDTGKTGINAPVKRATGGSSDILPLFDTMAQRTLQTYKAVAKNRFGVELKDALGTTIGTEAADVDSVIDGIDQHEELLQKGKNGRKPTFTVFEGGEKVTFEITEDMYDALKPTNEALTYTNKVANKISTLHRGVLTEYNPSFMARNIIKDVQDVLINSQHPAKTYANFPKAIKELTTKGDWYKEYVKNGGEQNSYFDKKTNTFVEDKSAFVKTVGMPLNAISEANNFIEKLPRLAEYIASREEGRSVEVSMLDSARVTTNFAAGGDLTKFLNRNGATFLNASVQGAMQQVRNVREAKMNGLKGWTQLATKYAIAGLPILLLNGLLWDDDEDYEELSDYVKQNYYVVAKYGDGKFVRIPKGRTLAVIQNALEQTTNALTGNDEVDLQSFLQLAISNLAPNNPIENNILAPIIQVANNETWYGDELVPTRLQDLPAEEQYDESTDSISRWLGEKLKYSPYKINYLLNQYSGGIGDSILPMFTPEAESGDDTLTGQMLAPIRDSFTTDSILKNQNVSDFYDTSDKLTVNANKSSATDEDILANKYFNSVKGEIGKLYGEKREIQSSDLSDSEKYYLVRELQKQINTLSEEALAEYKNVNIEGDYATVGDRQYRRTDNGWEKLSDEQIEKQDEVTSSLGITPNEYWSNKEEYNFAYESSGKYAISKAVGGYDVYKSHLSELNDIRADKDINGNSVSGSAKQKKAAYINSLDIDYGQKIILYRSLYDSKDDKAAYNGDILDYLNSRDDISYEEMVAILEELDFKVHSDGRVTW